MMGLSLARSRSVVCGHVDMVWYGCGLMAVDNLGEMLNGLLERYPVAMAMANGNTDVRMMHGMHDVGL